MNYILTIYKSNGTKRFVGLFADYTAAKVWANANRQDNWSHYEADPINEVDHSPLPTA